MVGTSPTGGAKAFGWRGWLSGADSNHGPVDASGTTIARKRPPGASPAPIDIDTSYSNEWRDTPGSTTIHIGVARTSTVDRIGERPSPLEQALVAVGRGDVHIERVWPMRSPPTERLEASSSAFFQIGCPGPPPPDSTPVEGLQMNQAFAHEPVMAAEVVDRLSPVPPGLVIDATVGGGGHAEAVLDAYPHLSVLGLDRDPTAVAAATDRLARFGARATIRHARFDQLASMLADEMARRESSGGPGAVGVSAVLFDLGVSSPQLDTAERGFSYRRDAPLDMRMDPTAGRTAAAVVNEFSEDALVELFVDNGEGRFARRIARAVVAARPITTTGELADVVREAIPAATRRTGGHPARRVFQAIRIAVNEELDQLGRAMDDALDVLGLGGRCIVIAYHSGEDRLVKSTFLTASTGGCTCPPGLPCVCGADPAFRLVVRGARRPTSDEVERNRRSEAARLRVIERVADRRPGTLHEGEVA